MRQQQLRGVAAPILAIALFSALTTVTATASPALPATPTIEAPASGASTIEVRFAPNVDHGSTITEFAATCTSSDGGTGAAAHGFGIPYGDGGRVITVSGVTIGHTYTCTLDATSDGGTSPESAPSTAVIVGRPSAPIVYDLAIGATSVAFTAVRPGDGGAIGTHFAVVCTSMNGGLTRTMTSPSAAITVTALTAGKTYSCSVRAVNASGPGLNTDTDAFIVGRPSAPEVIDIAPSPGELIPIVEPPNSTGGAPITGYAATCTSSDGGASGSATVSVLPIHVSGLDDGHTYTCDVQARNASGYGPTDESAEIRPGRPAAPFVGFPIYGLDDATVAFVGTFNDGGSPVTSNEAVCTSTDGGTAASNTGTSSPITVHGLTEGASYRCTVTASNVFGPGVPGGPASPARIGRPTQVFVDSYTPGPGSVTIGFRAPSDDGGASVMSYTAHCDSPDGSAPGEVTGTDPPLVVTGLADGSEYSCGVYATTSEGSGADGSRFEFAMPGRATAPGITSATGGNGAVMIGFDGPASDGGTPITDFTAACASNDGGTAGSKQAAASPIAVTGLTNGATYHCEVWGNAAGGPGMRAETVLTVGTVPLAPHLHALTPGNGAISIGFLAPANTGGLPITSYSATCTSSNGGVTRSMSGTSTTIAVTGLTNTKTYACHVSATTDAGTGPASSTSGPFRPGLPTAPVLRSAKASNAAITVAFAKPVTNGGFAVTGYTAACNSSNGGLSRTRTGPTSPLKVSGLTNGRKYTCRVVARNAEGSGTVSIASPVLTPHA